MPPKKKKKSSVEPSEPEGLLEATPEKPKYLGRASTSPKAQITPAKKPKGKSSVPRVPLEAFPKESPVAPTPPPAEPKNVPAKPPIETFTPPETPKPKTPVMPASTLKAIEEHGVEVMLTDSTCMRLTTLKDVFRWLEPMSQEHHKQPPSIQIRSVREF